MQSETPSQIAVDFSIANTFKDVIIRFRTSGAMSESLLELLEVDSVDELRIDQERQSVMHASHSNSVSDDIALTLTAIAILNQYFIDDRKLWILVENKAYKYIMKNTTYSK